MTVKEIILDFLNKNNYDGLFNPDINCGCGIDDFIPCDITIDECQPAYKKKCEKCEDYNNVEGCLNGNYGIYGCFSTQKDEEL